MILSFLSAVITRPSFLFQEQVIVGIKTLLQLLAKFQLLAGAFKLKQKSSAGKLPRVFHDRRKGKQRTHERI
jgi:hypothetical protein